MDTSVIAAVVSEAQTSCRAQGPILIGLHLSLKKKTKAQAPSNLLHLYYTILAKIKKIQKK